MGGRGVRRTMTPGGRVKGELRGGVDEATGKWGIRVNRVELKAVDPPRTTQGAMEKQMRADRDKRAAILTAEGLKQLEAGGREGRQVRYLHGAPNAEEGAGAAGLTPSLSRACYCRRRSTMSLACPALTNA